MPHASTSHVDSVTIESPSPVAKVNEKGDAKSNRYPIIDVIPTPEGSSNSGGVELPPTPLGVTRLVFGSGSLGFSLAGHQGSLFITKVPMGGPAANHGVEVKLE